MSKRLTILTLVSLMLITGCDRDSWLNQKIYGKRYKTDYVQTPGACQKPGVVRLPRSITTSSDSQLKSFDYAVQYLPPTKEGAPTVVYLPGGPGQTSIGDDERWLRDLPAGYGLMLTDPRGVGCNYVDYHNLPTWFYTSEAVAEDVVFAVETLGVKNFIYYGISYGTVVATIAGSLSEPKAVVLEGTLGKAFKNEQEAEDTYNRLWQQKLDSLGERSGAEAVSKFKQDPLPLGISEEKWRGAIRMGLLLGSVKSDSGITDITSEMLDNAISSSSPKQDSARITIEKLTADEPDVDGSNVFYMMITCQEILSQRNSLHLKGGVFVLGKEEYCQQVHLALSHPFDAKAWQIKAPLYYIQGTDDPATPVEFAQYHFRNQTSSAHREMLLVEKAGHNPISASLSDCNDGLWEKMATGSSLSEVLSSCNWTPGFKQQ